MDLNNSCPKDPFTLLHIDSMIDVTASNELLTFMDALAGFQQFQSEPCDLEETIFITSIGIYWYNFMPFGLKNEGATFQRLVYRIFKDKLGGTIDVYIDDMFDIETSQNHDPKIFVFTYNKSHNTKCHIIKTIHRVSQKT